MSKLTVVIGLNCNPVIRFWGSAECAMTDLKLLAPILKALMENEAILQNQLSFREKFIDFMPCRSYVHRV